MVFVFGIDVPLLELLFIYVILILFALVIVMVEIAKLRKLLMIEKGMVAKPSKQEDFIPEEKPVKQKPEPKKQKVMDENLDAEIGNMPDLGMGEMQEKKGFFSSLFKKQDSPMGSDTLSFPQSQVNDLRKYIKSCYKNGFSNQEIKDILMKTGWPKELVDAELGKA